MKRKGIPPLEFFKQLSIHSGITDLDVVRSVYYGMIKTISRGLKTQHSLRLPDWGEFYLVIQKSRPNRAVVGDRIVQDILPPIPMVKFSPDKAVKKYFQEFGKGGL